MQRFCNWRSLYPWSYGVRLSVNLTAFCSCSALYSPCMTLCVFCSVLYSLSIRWRWLQERRWEGRGQGCIGTAGNAPSPSLGLVSEPAGISFSLTAPPPPPQRHPPYLLTIAGSAPTAVENIQQTNFKTFSTFPPPAPPQKAASALPQTVVDSQGQPISFSHIFHKRYAWASVEQEKR